MQVRASWVAGDQVAELEILGRVASIEDVYALDVQLRRALEPIFEHRGGRFPVLIGVSGLEIAREQSQVFGKVMADVREEFSSVMARWGDGLVTRQIIAIESMKLQHAANLFESREDAIDFLRKVQRGEILASHRSSVPPPRPPSGPPFDSDG